MVTRRATAQAWFADDSVIRLICRSAASRIKIRFHEALVQESVSGTSRVQAYKFKLTDNQRPAPRADRSR